MSDSRPSRVVTVSRADCYSKAPVSPWPCLGWSRCRFGATEPTPVWRCRGRLSFPNASPRCSWPAASTRIIGGPRATGSGRWSLGKSLAPMEPLKEKMNFISRAVQQERHGRRHSSGSDRQHPLGCVVAEGSRTAGRHQRRPGVGQSLGAGDGSTQHGAGLRTADHRLSRDELLDGLQFAHFLAECHVARPDGSLPFAGLRQPVR